MTNLGNEGRDFHVAGSRVKTLRRIEGRSTLYYQSALLVLCLILRHLPIERGTLTSWSAVKEGSPGRRMNLRKELAADVL